METTRPEVLSSYLNIMRIASIYPRFGETNLRWFYLRARIITSISILITLGTLNHLIYNLYYGLHLTIDEIVADVYMVSISTSVIYVAMCLINYREVLQDLIKSLGDCRSGKPKTLDSTNDKMNQIVRGYMVYITVGVSSYILMMFFDNSLETCHRNKATFNSRNTCGLYSNAWYFYDLDFFLIKHIVLFVQTLINGGLIAVAGSATCIIYAASEILAAKIEHLQDLIEDAAKNVKRQNMDNIKRKLVFCVAYHLDIIRIVGLLGKIVGFTCFVHITATAIVMGLGISMLIVFHSPKFISHAVGFAIGLFVACRGGQRLVDKSVELQLTLYQMPWYDMDDEVRKLILFMLMRSQKELILNVAGLSNIDYNTFKTVLEAAYSYTALLQSRY